MRLYHFTRLATLVGDSGLDVIERRVGESVDLFSVAASSSILAAGLRPRKTLVFADPQLLISGAAVAGPLEDGQAAYRRGDYPTAMSYWRPLAEQGNAVAQVNLGAMYASGRGVPQDHAQAFALFSKAAEQGFAGAQEP
jgi:TPR repeat protein